MAAASAAATKGGEAGAQGERVLLYLYDLTQGMAKALSPGLLGKQIEGVWHTGIVVFGHEYYYGGGIQWSLPGQSQAGRPTRVIEMGFTQVPMEVFHDFLHSISPRFRPETYSLLNHNCNNFTSECAQFLVGRDIPAFITGLPQEFLATPLGQMFAPFIHQMEQQMKSQMGAHMVPWREDAGAGGERLNLPAQARAAAAAAHPAPIEPAPPAAAAAAAAVPAAAAAAPAPAPAAAAAPSASPLLAREHKAKSFAAVIRASAGTVPEAVRLSEPERQTLATLADALGEQKEAAKQVAEGVALLEGKLLLWPQEKLMPVLGLVREVLLRAEAHGLYASRPEAFARLVARLLGLCQSRPDAQSPPRAAALMALCSLANAFSDGALGDTVARTPGVVDAAVSALASNDESMRAMGAALMHNVALHADAAGEEAAVRAASALAESLAAEKAPEVTERALLAAGHLAVRAPAAREVLVALEVAPQAISARFAAFPRVAKAAAWLDSLLA